MSVIPQLMLVAGSKASYELPTFSGNTSSSYNYSSPSAGGTYGFEVDVCSNLTNGIVIRVKRDGGNFSSQIITLTTPSGFDRTKFNYQIVSTTGLSGMTQNGNSSGALGAVISWNTSYSSSSINRSGNVRLRLIRKESPSSYIEITLDFQFIKPTWVDPKTANSGSLSISPIWISSVGGYANVDVTFAADRSASMRAVWVDSGFDQTTTGTWLQSGYTASDYEAQIGGETSWTQLPATINMGTAFGPATNSTSGTNQQRFITIRNKSTGSEATWSISATINGPLTTALVYPSLTFPTDSFENEGWSWSFSLNSDGTYTSTYSTDSNNDGSYTATGRWLREGYPANNYRFTNLSQSILQGSGTTGFSGSVSGIGNISTGGASFGAGGNSGQRIGGGRLGSCQVQVKIENIAMGGTVAQPGVLLNIEKKL